MVNRNIPHFHSRPCRAKILETEVALFKQSVTLVSYAVKCGRLSFDIACAELRLMPSCEYQLDTLMMQYDIIEKHTRKCVYLYSLQSPTVLRLHYYVSQVAKAIRQKSLKSYALRNGDRK